MQKTDINIKCITSPNGHETDLLRLTNKLESVQYVLFSSRKGYEAVTKPYQ